MCCMCRCCMCRCPDHPHPRSRAVRGLLTRAIHTMSTTYAETQEARLHSLVYRLLLLLENPEISGGGVWAGGGTGDLDGDMGLDNPAAARRLAQAGEACDKIARSVEMVFDSLVVEASPVTSADPERASQVARDPGPDVTPERCVAAVPAAYVALVRVLSQLLAPGSCARLALPTQTRGVVLAAVGAVERCLLRAERVGPVQVTRVKGLPSLLYESAGLCVMAAGGPHEAGGVHGLRAREVGAERRVLRGLLERREAEVRLGALHALARVLRGTGRALLLRGLEWRLCHIS